MDDASISLWSTLASGWSQPVLHALTEGSLAFVIVWVVWRGLRRFTSANVGYALFAIVLVKLLASMALPIGSSWHGWLSPSEWFVSTARIPPEALVRAEVMPATVGSDPVTAPEFGFERWALLVWGVIVLACTVRFFKRQGQLMAIVRRARNARARDVAGVDLAELRATAGVRRRVRWLVSSDVASPAAGGIVRPFVLLPPEFARGMSVAAVRFVLLHELAHISRHDAAVSLVQRAAQILLFFHPAVWWTNRALDELREFACDQSAVARCGGPDARRECGAGLLSVVENARGRDGRGAAHAMAIFGDDKSVIRRRLMNILHHPSQQGRLGRALGLAIVCAIATLVLPNASASAALDAQDPGARDPQRQLERLERRIERLQQQQAELQRELERARETTSPDPKGPAKRSSEVVRSVMKRLPEALEVDDVAELVVPIEEAVAELTVPIEVTEFATPVEVDDLAEIVFESFLEGGKDVDVRDLAGIFMRRDARATAPEGTRWRVLRAAGDDASDASEGRSPASARTWSKSISITIDSDGRVQIDESADSDEDSNEAGRAEARSDADSKVRTYSTIRRAKRSEDRDESSPSVILDGDGRAVRVLPDGRVMWLDGGRIEVHETRDARDEQAPRAGATKRVERARPAAPRVLRRASDRSPI